VRRGRGRAPSVPRGRRCLHGHVCIPYPPPAALQRLVPVTPVQQPVPGCSSHEASARVHWRSPLPAFPSPVTPGRIGGPRALPRASHPAGQDPAAHAGAGTGLRHWPGVTSPPSTAASFLDAPTHYERHHVATHDEERSSPGDCNVWLPRNLPEPGRSSPSKPAIPPTPRARTARTHQGCHHNTRRQARNHKIPAHNHAVIGGRLIRHSR